MRLIEVTGLKETNFSNPFSICCLHNRSQQHLGQVTGPGMGEGRVSLRQEHFLLLLLYCLLPAHLFFRFGWSKEPSHQAAPFLVPALWPRWRKNLQLFSETQDSLIFARDKVKALPFLRWKIEDFTSGPPPGSQSLFILPQHLLIYYLAESQCQHLPSFSL